jgi:hypothetical protein
MYYIREDLSIRGNDLLTPLSKYMEIKADYSL